MSGEGRTKSTSYVADVNTQFLKQKSQEQYEHTIRHANVQGGNSSKFWPYMAGLGTWQG